MDITYCAKDCFKIATKALTVTINPEGDVDKLKDLVLLSVLAKKYTGEAIVLDAPGEYEVRSCMVDGIDLGELTGFAVAAEGIRIGYVPAGVGALSDKQVEAYDSIDVLIVPMADDKAEATNKLIGQFEPRIVVPYGHNKEQFAVLSAEFGGEVQTVEKLKITNRDLDTEKQQLIAFQ